LVLPGHGNILTHRKAIIGFKGQKVKKVKKVKKVLDDRHFSCYTIKEAGGKQKNDCSGNTR
jgi:hypothetical protein